MRARKLTTVGRRRARTQTGTFGGGVVKVRQPRRGRGRVDLYLRGGNFGGWARATRAGRTASASRVKRVRVTNGAVVVRDLTRRRSVVVRAGHPYLAPRGPHLARRRN